MDINFKKEFEFLLNKYKIKNFKTFVNLYNSNSKEKLNYHTFMKSLDTSITVKKAKHYLNFIGCDLAIIDDTGNIFSIVNVNFGKVKDLKKF